jgi:putative ABC transport system substrate-binding protein
VTGIALSLDQLSAKHVEIMREIRPRLARVGMLVDTTGRGCDLVEQSAREATRSVSAAFVSYPVANRDEINGAGSRMGKERPDVLLPCPTALLFNNRDLLYENAVRLRIPFTSFVTANLPLGVLFSYSASFAEEYRLSASSRRTNRTTDRSVPAENAGAWGASMVRRASSSG